MANLKELRDERLRKLYALKKYNIEPYPQIGERTSHNASFLDDFDELSGKNVKSLGRITSIRLMGGMCFLDISDESGRMQIVLNKKTLLSDPKKNQLDYKQLRLLDTGDFIQAEGELGKTNKGEISVFCKHLTFLSKSLRPLPDAHEGFVDIEKRYRQRYIDLQINKEVKKHIELRSKTVQILRQFLNNRGFIELETPVLQPLYGGASARPFTTYHHKLETDLYLRISNELYLKRAIVAGFEKVFEFSKDFRNEGIDRSHNPEFTMLEFYWAYSNYEDLMTLTEQLFSEVLMALFGQLKISYQGEILDFTPPFKRITFQELILKETGIDILSISKDSLLKEMKNRRIDIDYEKNLPKKDLIDEFYKEACRTKIKQPIFLVDYPANLAPLAKLKADNPEIVAKMQLVCMGTELINAYNELNDPLDQLNRMSSEQKVLEKGESDEAQPLDYDYIRALEIGMPPTAGWGMGIDRFVSFLVDQPAIKDVILFPTLRPEKIDGEEFKVDKEIGESSD